MPSFFAGLGLAMAGLLGFCLIPLPNRHMPPIWTRIDLALCLLPVVGVLYWPMTYFFRPCAFVFDRVRGQVFFNGCPILAMAELQSVCLERTGWRDSTATILSLRTKNRGKIEIARDALWEATVPEMRRMAEQIAGFAGINLVTPDGFVPGRRNRGMSLSGLKRWAKKPRGRRLARQPKAQIRA